MEFIIELILDLFFDGVEEILPNTKIPKKIRVALGITACIILGAIILGVVVLGSLLIKQSLLGGLFIIFVGLSLAIAFIIKIIKTKNKMGL